MGVLVTAALAGCIALCGAAWRTRDSAAHLLEAVREIFRSSSPNSEFEIVRQHYQGQLKEGENCTPSDCQYKLTISNRSVSWTHLVPYTELNAHFTIYQNNPSFFYLTFHQQLRSGSSPVVHVQGDFSNEAWASFHLNPHGRSDELWNGIVEFNLAATRAQRDAALDLNLDCFVKLGGCHDISQIAPKIWRVTAPNDYL